MTTFTNGQNFKVLITLDCQLVTDESSVTKEQIQDIISADINIFQSIIIGKVNPNCKDDHDTEIILESVELSVV